MTLEEREAAALVEIEAELVFGSEPRSLKEIGDRLGRSRESVRLIEAAALEKLHRVMLAEGLDDRPRARRRRPRLPPRCGECGGDGHNRRSCTATIAAAAE